MHQSTHFIKTLSRGATLDSSNERIASTASVRTLCNFSGIASTGSVATDR